MVRTRLKMAATLTVVVLALTGFQTGHGSSSSGGGSGKSKSGKSRGGDDDSGGGCSSDEKSNDDYSGSGGSGSQTTAPTPTASRAVAEVVVVDCVKPAQKKRKGKPARKADTSATLRITSKSAYTETFEVTLEFKGSTGSAVDSTEALVTVEGGGTKTFEVEMKTPKAVGRVKDCWVYDVRRSSDATATPSATAS
ncbi:hypothetical protein AQF52_3515 [Streptomyces venezuelae]|uniref:hypothetical protein n=1 Tax=Streptomyces gardneri TaxID=66892 RepID=UPI0006BC1707|nr:hypothetical protein [Streptomyces gardneri]ALO09109.1 hypothetical protein AQF52_3515 [Streptomyces venezuelae]QPK46247.1 hypothetical protein H4W23_17500 [Streptomyces gardneri]WRK37620.1 hypothetical protein U0M97_17585 [Streptomyces venezuelae]CUM40491.1 putative secreted protein [Streptomyces venezuelae]